MHFGEPGQAIDFPFFIEWADGDDERLAQLEASGAINMKQSITMESVQFFLYKMRRLPYNVGRKYYNYLSQTDNHRVSPYSCQICA